MTYLDTVARFVADTRAEDMDPEVLERTALILADCIGAIAGGATEPEVRALAARPGLSAPGPAAVIGTRARVQPMAAALLNGTAGTALEMDEGTQFARGHPGIHTVPAVLAFLAARPDRTVPGRELLTAIALGYEVGARVGIASKLRPAMHPHGTWGAICAAVGVARLAGRDAAGIARAMSMAAGLGLSTNKRTMLEGGTVRNVYAGVSNQMGLLVEDLAAAGFEADRDGVAQVFGHVASDSFDAGAMTEALGSRWEVCRNYFKLHACCRYNHAALDALEMILAEAGPLEPAAVTEVAVESYSLAAELDDPTPRNALAARFSVPFAMATRLVTGTSTVESFAPERVDDPATLALAARVSLREDPAMTAALPDRRPARVTLTLADGRRLTRATETNRGDWADPFPPEALAQKFHSLAIRAWPEAETQALWQATLTLPDTASVAGWLDRLSVR